MRQSADPDAVILATVTRMKDFLHSALVDDVADDWRAAKNLGELLVRIDPEEILGHALLARACRHLGDAEQAADEVAQCRRLIASYKNSSVIELFQSVVAAEDRHIGHSL